MVLFCLVLLFCLVARPTTLFLTLSCESQSDEPICDVDPRLRRRHHRCADDRLRSVQRCRRCGDGFPQRKTPSPARTPLPRSHLVTTASSFATSQPSREFDRSSPIRSTATPLPRTVGRPAPNRAGRLRKRSSSRSFEPAPEIVFRDGHFYLTQASDNR